MTSKLQGILNVSFVVHASCSSNENKKWLEKKSWSPSIFENASMDVQRWVKKSICTKSFSLKNVYGPRLFRFDSLATIYYLHLDLHSFASCTTLQTSSVFWAEGVVGKESRMKVKVKGKETFIGINASICFCFNFFPQGEKLFQ